MPKFSRQSAGGSAGRAQLPHGLPGLRPAMTKGNERKRFGGETPTDAMNILPWLTATAAPGAPGAHLSAFHRGSRPKESFIARDSAPGFLFLGLGGQFGCPSSGRYPPLPVPVQRTQSRPGRSAEGLMPECRPGAGCKAARGHRTRPREPGLPPGRDRTRRGSKLYVTITETFVNKTVTNSFRPSPAFFTTLLSSLTHSAFPVHQTSQSEILL